MTLFSIKRSVPAMDVQNTRSAHGKELANSSGWRDSNLKHPIEHYSVLANL
jgi:hypothetical protein